MPTFTSNYPGYEPQRVTLLPTPQRLSAPSDFIGRGVVIAFIDAGFSMHPDVADRVLVHVDASTQHVIEQPRVEEITDLSWHGQMTTVIACGDGRTSNGQFRGIAYGSSLVLVKVSTPRGQVKEPDILRGLQWVADTHKRFNVRVVNISVGGDFVSADPNHPLHRVVRKLTEAGVIVVAAAGNANAGHVLPPASAPHAITVGGYSDHNTLDRSQWTSYHHNHGQAYDGTFKPEVLAPAEWIASPILPGSLVQREARWLAPLLNGDSERALKRLLQEGYAELGIDGQAARAPDDKLYGMLQARINGYKLVDWAHQHVDGTSVASAIATSVIAQMIEANPRLTPWQARAALTSSASRLSSAPLDRQGAGIINAARAIQASLALRR